MRKINIKIWVIAVLIISLFIIPALADNATGALNDKISIILELVQENYYKTVKTQDLINGALKGMFTALDPHSMYFTKEEFTEFNSELNGELIGIGVQVEIKDSRVTVIAPIEGGPADKAGIRSGDKIIYVDKTDISSFTLEQATKRIRGEAGTKVKIGIQRNGIKDILYFDIIREAVKTNPVKYEIKPQNIGYIRITEFNGNTYNNIKTAVDTFKSKNVKGIIIDVRDNPGGLLDEVVKICRLLIPKGPIVHVDYKNQPKETQYSTLPQAPFEVIVLVNEGSASASEILAGAIRDSGTGKLLGVKTYGKGTVQSVMRFLDGSGLKMTVANYLTPSGYSLDGKGLKPDIEVKNLTDFGADPDYAPIKGDRALKVRTVGIDVYGLQQRLNQLGYFTGTIDGVYGTTTKYAVLKFEKDKKLKQDGILEPSEIKVLKEIPPKGDPQLERALTEIQKMIKSK